MPEQAGGGATTSLMSKFLMVSGIVCLLLGILILLFVNVPVGIVLMIAGVLDLTVSAFIFRMAGRQQ